MASFPVINNNVDLEQFFAQYGTPRNQSGVGNDMTVPINTEIGSGGTVLASATLNSKEMMFVKSIIVSCNRDIRARVMYQFRSSTFDGAGNLGADNGSTSFQIKAGTPFVLPLNVVVSGSVISEISLRCSRNFASEETGMYAEINVCGYSMYEDLDFSSNGKILALGDSIMKGFTGSNKKDGHFLWKTKNFIATKGKRLQIINQAVSGSTSQLVRGFISNGYLSYVPSLNYIFENHGANDSTQNTTDAQFTAYVDELCAWKQQMYPNAMLILFGSTTLQNTTNNTRANAFRTIKQNKVTALNDPKIKYFNLDVITNPATADYVSSDAVGSGVHPNDQGNNKIWAALSTFLQTII